MNVDGFILVDKPGRWTSHDVVAKFRSLTGIRKIGHAGTLDPMATGLLVLGLNRATRLLRFVQSFPKQYEAIMRMGIATDTLDAYGAETERLAMTVTEADIASALGLFRGQIEQVPPMTSAVKVGGKKLYELARKGEEIARPARTVTVHSLELMGFEPGEFPSARLRVLCSTGTYVRSLADDIARSLGGRAHLTQLRRTRIGTLRVDAAMGMDAAIAAPHALMEAVVSPGAALADLGSVTVRSDVGARVSNGFVFPIEELPIDGTRAVLDGTGRLLAVYRRDGDRARPEVVVA